MTNTFLTIVANQNFKYDESVDFLKNHFYLDIANSTILSDNAISFEIRDFDESKKTHMKKVFTQKKIDFCFLDKFKIPSKIFLCDMDSTIIKNETLDDLVKMCGAEARVIDETSRLAMEGKIDIKSTLSSRVSLLKGKPKSMIEDVIKGIKYNQGSNTLIKTLNNNKFNTYLITGGFKPISTYVGERLEFQNIISNEFEFENDNTFKGTYVPIAGEKNSKLEFMRKLSAEKDIEFKDFVALGDGANDLGMLQNSGLGIGYNSHKIIKDNIETQINFTDLTSVLYFLQIKKEDFIR
tara:strand:+ start:959 stop:1843 length:885 start_codon:yes stop_codon:yes gene_type:complete